jgi:hypothetical protein
MKREKKKRKKKNRREIKEIKKNLYSRDLILLLLDRIILIAFILYFI